VSRAGRVGAALVGLYVLVAVATLGLSGHRLLPLFEGIGGPVPYRWVHPPPQFATGNIKPEPVALDIPFRNGAAGAQSIATTDGQFVVNLSAGSFAPRPGDTSVHAAVTPLDPASLPPLPAGAAADGNAYRIELTYKPSNAPVTKLAASGDVIVTSPHNATGLWFSADGRSWTKLPSQIVGGPTFIGAPFNAPGWYLVGTNPSNVSSGSGGTGTVLVAVGVVAGAVLLGLVALFAVVRSRRVSPEAGRRRDRAGRRPPGRGAGGSAAGRGASGRGAGGASGRGAGGASGRGASGRGRRRRP
jgi:hypothetical protein